MATSLRALALVLLLALCGVVTAQNLCCLPQSFSTSLMIVKDDMAISENVWLDQLNELIRVDVYTASSSGSTSSYGTGSYSYEAAGRKKNAAAKLALPLLGGAPTLTESLYMLYDENIMVIVDYATQSCVSTPIGAFQPSCFPSSTPVVGTIALAGQSLPVVQTGNQTDMVFTAVSLGANSVCQPVLQDEFLGSPSYTSGYATSGYNSGGYSGSGSGSGSGYSGSGTSSSQSSGSSSQSAGSSGYTSGAAVNAGGKGFSPRPNYGVLEFEDLAIFFNSSSAAIPQSVFKPPTFCHISSAATSATPAFKVGTRALRSVVPFLPF